MSNAVPGPAIHVPPLELSVRLYDRFESIREVSSYYGILAIYGLCRTAELADDGGKLMDRCRAILGRFPNEILHVAYNFPSYRIGGIARAYMVWREHMADDVSREYVAHYAEEMMLAARDPGGIICNPYKPREQLVWIDVAMATAPYLLYAGLAFDERLWLDEAARQAILHYELFLDPANGLLHQARGFNGFGRFTQDHWGRGTGWGYIALTELVEHLPADCRNRRVVERYFCDLSRAVLPHQSQRGLWRQEIPLPTAWEESSGTALALYGFAVGMRKGLLDEQTFGPAFERGMRGLRAHCIREDGSTDLCCPSCLCPGEGERKGTVAAYVEDRQPARDDIHSFGLFMLALTEEARLAATGAGGRR
jgi:unsaturated rhamnogalacturonyl hydrolase